MSLADISKEYNDKLEAMKKTQQACLDLLDKQRGEAFDKYYRDLAIKNGGIVTYFVLTVPSTKLVDVINEGDNVFSMHMEYTPRKQPSMLVVYFRTEEGRAEFVRRYDVGTNTKWLAYSDTLPLLHAFITEEGTDGN